MSLRIGPWQNSEKQGLVNWFTTVLFDVEIPVSWFEFKKSPCKFVNLTISGGIGPIQSHDKTTKKGVNSYLVDGNMAALETNRKVKK
jgi:hypothetical protein